MDGGKEGGTVLAEPASFHQLRIELLREGQVFVDDVHQVAAGGGCFGDVRGRNQDTNVALRLIRRNQDTNVALRLIRCSFSSFLFYKLRDGYNRSLFFLFPMFVLTFII